LLSGVLCQPGFTDKAAVDSTLDCASRGLAHQHVEQQPGLDLQAYDGIHELPGLVRGASGGLGHVAHPDHQVKEPEPGQPLRIPGGLGCAAFLQNPGNAAAMSL
jgi:hypothetical protein